MDESKEDRAEHMPEPCAPASRWSMSPRRWRVPVAAALIAIVAFLGVLPLQVCRDDAFVCENTGSQKGYRWTSYQGTGRNILGQAGFFAHASPRIHTIMMCPAWFDRYVDALDDAGRLALYHVLVAGNPEAIRAEEKKIEEMALAEAWALR